MDAVGSVIVHEELSYSDPAFCLSYLAHSLLLVNNLSQNGSYSLKKKYLPSLCDGSKIGGMCMSEAGAGTDIMSMTTSVTRTNDSYYTLNGTIMWITNGTLDGISTGDLFLLYAKQINREDVSKPSGKQGLSAFIVEKGVPGFELGSKITDKCGMRASMTAELVFSEVQIPVENLVGEEGKATQCMMRNLEIERLALAAMSLGIAKRSIDIMIKSVS